MTTQIKVLQVAPAFPPDRGGIALSVSNLCDGLAFLGDHVEVVAPRKIVKPREFTQNIETSGGISKVHRISSFFLPGWPYPTLRSLSIPSNLWITLDKIIRNGTLMSFIPMDIIIPFVGSQ